MDCQRTSSLANRNSSESIVQVFSQRNFVANGETRMFSSARARRAVSQILAASHSLDDCNFWRVHRPRHYEKHFALYRPGVALAVSEHRGCHGGTRPVRRPQKFARHRIRNSFPALLARAPEIQCQRAASLELARCGLRNFILRDLRGDG